MKKLIIVGAGGFGREVYGWALSDASCGDEWEVAGFIDDNPAALDGFEYTVSVLGSIDAHQPAGDELFVCAIGAPSVKRALCEKLLARGAQFTSVVHATSLVGANVQLGRGVVLCPYSVITCDSRVGDFAAINCHSSVGHDVTIGAWVTLSGHCDVTGQTEIGEMAFLGSGARILPLKRVGARATVGAGSVVISHVADDEKVFGNSARAFE